MRTPASVPVVTASLLGGLAERDELRALAELAQRALLQLAGALGRDAQLLAGLRQRLGLVVAGAEAHLDDVALGLRELGDRGQERLGLELLLDLLVDRRRLDGEQVTERGVAVVADGLVERDDRAVGLADLDDVGQREVGRVGDLLVGRLVTQLGRQLALDAPHLAGPLRHVDGQADRAAGVLQPALDRLADPQRRVGREAEALAPVELLDGADQAEHALLDQVAEREALALVAARVGHHEAQVRVDHAVLGDEVALLDPLGKLDLLSGREQLEAARLAQEELQRIQRRIHICLVLLLGVLLGRSALHVSRGHVPSSFQSWSWRKTNSPGRNYSQKSCRRNCPARYHARESLAGIGAGASCTSPEWPLRVASTPRPTENVNPQSPVRLRTHATFRKHGARDRPRGVAGRPPGRAANGALPGAARAPFGPPRRRSAAAGRGSARRRSAARRRGMRPGRSTADRSGGPRPRARRPRTARRTCR